MYFYMFTLCFYYRQTCVFAWLYCLAMSLPPFFGWSKYEPEGFLTSCSWDYTTRSSANRAYYIYLLTLGFVMPVAVISYCYVFIMVAILAHGREMKDVKANGNKIICGHMWPIKQNVVVLVNTYRKIPTSLYKWSILIDWKQCLNSRFSWIGNKTDHLELISRYNEQNNIQ